jgi:hypothetical protein
MTEAVRTVSRRSARVASWFAFGILSPAGVQLPGTSPAAAKGSNCERLGSRTQFGSSTERRSFPPTA